MGRWTRKWTDRYGLHISIPFYLLITYELWIIPFTSISPCNTADESILGQVPMVNYTVKNSFKINHLPNFTYRKPELIRYL
jgi:hypothetical protein